MKKILILFLVLVLCSCKASEEKEETAEENIYLDPVKEVEVFSFLNDETYDLLYAANGSEVPAYILEDLGKELPDYCFTDYYGNTVDLSDYRDSKLIIEVAAFWCSHCMEQSRSYTDELLKTYPDITLIQYFNEGSKEQVATFYAEIGLSVPTDIPVICQDEGFGKIISETFALQYTPSFLFFDQGKLTWIKISSLKTEEMEKVYDIAFGSALDINDLCDASGNSIFSYTRSKEDVRNDLSEENYGRLKEVNIDAYSENLTLSYLGKAFDFYNQFENDSDFESEVDFLDYTDKDMVIIYLYESDEATAQLLNDLYNAYSNISFAILNTSDYNCEAMAEAMDAPVVSIMNQVPNILNEFSFLSYPDAIFVEKGTITGILTDLNAENFSKATDIFFGGNSIALKINN